MRIGFDGRWYNRSGVGTYVAELLPALAMLPGNFELVLFEDPQNPLPANDRLNISRVLVRSSRFSPRAQFELKTICESQKIDLFHVPYQYGAPLFLSCPLVVTVHDLTPFLFPTRSWLKQLLAVPLVKLGYRMSAHRASHIICDSHNTARDVHNILKVPPKRITAIHLAASGEHFHPRPHDDDSAAEAEYLFAKYSLRAPFVLTSSADNWRIKNLSTPLHALDIAHKLSSIDFQTVVYGSHTGLDALGHSHPALGMNVHRLGYVPVDDLAALLRHASLFITASLYEGFGLPILEAMSCGCPVVTSNGGSLAEVAAAGAQVFDPMDAEGMGRAVATLLRDPEQRYIWRNRALARARDFSWLKAAEQTLAVYYKVLGCQNSLQPRFLYSYDDQNPRTQKSA